MRLVHKLANTRGCRVTQLICLQQLPEKGDPPVLQDWMPGCRADGVPMQLQEHSCASWMPAGPFSGSHMQGHLSVNVRAVTRGATHPTAGSTIVAAST